MVAVYLLISRWSMQRSTFKPQCSVCIDYSIQIGDIINIALLILTVVGLFFTVIQLFHTKKINRASLVREMYIQLYNDKEIRDVFYKLEWSDYSSEDILELGGTEEERKLDKLLSFFEVICNMYNRKIITKKDMAVFDYELLRVYSHPAIIDYLRFLDTWQKTQNFGKSYTHYKQYCQSRLPDT